MSTTKITKISKICTKISFKMRRFGMWIGILMIASLRLWFRYGRGLSTVEEVITNQKRNKIVLWLTGTDFDVLICFLMYLMCTGNGFIWRIHRRMMSVMSKFRWNYCRTEWRCQKCIRFVNQKLNKHARYRIKHKKLNEHTRYRIQHKKIKMEESHPTHKNWTSTLGIASNTKMEQAR